MQEKCLIFTGAVCRRLSQILGTAWVPTRQNKAFCTQMKRDSESGKVLAISNVFAHYEMNQDMKIPARNEKVACSSQVTSSRKTPGFLVKPGVFITF